jgi:dTDP-4-dehydrorhamnose reductase
MKLLVTGKNGQVGFELQRSLAPLGEVHAVDHAACDLRDEAAVRALVRSARPDVIVNAAAYTAVDRAESEPAIADAINARAPAVLGEEAAQLGALVVHYSTDYVFDGTLGRAHVETDPPRPLSVYGRSKLAGELGLAATGADHVILRTSWVYAARGNNFLRTMLRLGRERDELRVVDDQVGAPTSAALIADLTAHLLIQRRRGGFAGGLYHLVAAGETSWCGYARFLLGVARRAGVPLRVDPDAIVAIPTRSYPTPAARPLNSRLDTSRLSAALGLRLPPWQDGVTHTLAQLLNG